MPMLWSVKCCLRGMDGRANNGRKKHSPHDNKLEWQVRHFPKAMYVLLVTFDYKLQFPSISRANNALIAIKHAKQYFSTKELNQLIT